MSLPTIIFVALSFFIGEDKITVFVTSDYLKAVNNTYIHWSGKEVNDFLTMNPTLTYPPRHVVDQVWEQAECKLKPQPVSPNIPSNYPIHESIVQQQRDSQCNLNALIAGHKKDVVSSNNPSRIAIYGWHRLNGSVIQPYSTVHGNQYKDYSHGFRPMSKTIIINGKPEPYTELETRYGIVL